MGSSNPCLTILLCYSALVTIALIVTGSLLGTTHTSVTCAGGDTGVQVTHYSLLDRVRKENEQAQIKMRREWVRDAIELGALPDQASKGLAKPIPKDLE